MDLFDVKHKKMYLIASVLFRFKTIGINYQLLQQVAIILHFFFSNFTVANIATC